MPFMISLTDSLYFCSEVVDARKPKMSADITEESKYC